MVEESRLGRPSTPWAMSPWESLGRQVSSFVEPEQLRERWSSYLRKAGPVGGVP